MKNRDAIFVQILKETLLLSASFASCLGRDFPCSCYSHTMIKFMLLIIEFLSIKVDTATPMIDNKPPKTYMHLHLKLKNLQVSCDLLCFSKVLQDYMK